MSNLDLGVIGNCSWGGLVDQQARVVWSCLPRFDGDPTFCSLLQNGSSEPDFGFFDVVLDDFAESEQRYLGNSAILVTVLRDKAGNSVEIYDFAPRFVKSGRIYRPIMLVRQVRPLKGDPRIRIRLRPATGYGERAPDRTHGSNHIRYLLPATAMRVTTNAPVSYIMDEVPFVLEDQVDLIFGPDESLSGGITSMAREFHERTLDYWAEWSRTLSIPFEWQDAVIRAAITLKLCSFEETGAVIAALTTSIPEAADSQRNWDYRYCWLRDAYFVIHALNRLGTTKTMEGYLSYITNIVASAEDGHLQPVYGIALEASLIEREAQHLSGYRGMGPVRVGNQAYEHIQNDVYGSVVLAATQSFFDRRLLHPGGKKLFERLERVGEQALKLWDQPDAGLWELRTKSKIHTFSAVMCWAAAERLGRIAERLGNEDRAEYWSSHAARIRPIILERAWSEERNSLVDAFEGNQIDASLLLVHELGFLPADDPRFQGTLRAVGEELRRGNYLFRYADADDFGRPETAFNICTFWYIDALAAAGQKEEARELFENMLEHRNHLGLLSEDLDVENGELWGNFPQTYSMVGLINSAMRLSDSWEDAF